MTKPSTSDFLAAADAAYSGDPAGTSGLSLLTGADGRPVTGTRAADGFRGVAFETDAGQVIVSFEGTELGSLQTKPTFVRAQIQADGQIAEGRDPSLYADALRFTRRAVATAAAQGVPRGDIFVAGHSLGGAEAEYVAVKTGLGGDTFGAPGIPAADINTGLASTLTNFVDYGDPVGNYSADPDRVGRLLMGDDIERYGAPTSVGHRSDAGALVAAGKLYGTSDLGTAAAVGIVARAAADHHPLQAYAADLGVTLPDGGSASAANLTAADIEGALAIISGREGAGSAGAGGVGDILGAIGLDAPHGPSSLDGASGSAAHARGPFG